MFAAISAAGARARGWLNGDGAFAAFLLGWLVYFTGAWGASFTLLFFFVTSSVWSALPEKWSTGLSRDKDESDGNGSDFGEGHGDGLAPGEGKGDGSAPGEGKGEGPTPSKGNDNGKGIDESEGEGEEEGSGSICDSSPRSGTGSSPDHAAGPGSGTAASSGRGASSGLGLHPARGRSLTCDPSPRLNPSPRRNAPQVLANGLVAGLACLTGRTANALSSTQPDLIAAAAWVAFTAALAEATADTWASELGRLFGGRPHRLWDFRPVPAGTSGAISPVGTLAALAGAALLTLVSVELALAGLFPFLSASVFTLVAKQAAVAAMLAGFAGSLVDSLLGSRWQARYHCDHCGVETEEAIHRCGRPARLCCGLRWLDNNMVNLLSTVLAAALGLASVFLTLL